LRDGAVKQELDCRLMMCPAKGSAQIPTLAPACRGGCGSSTPATEDMAVHVAAVDAPEWHNPPHRSLSQGCPVGWDARAALPGTGLHAASSGLACGNEHSFE